MAVIHESSLSLTTARAPAGPKTYAVWLTGFLTLFILRVVGQILVATGHSPWLPPMEHWYSGLIPYPVLLPIQVALIILMTFVIRDIARAFGRFSRAHTTRGLFLKRFSYLYALFMVARYIITMSLHPEYRWLSHTIPIWFHFVLAAFVYTCGHYQIAFAPQSRSAPHK